MKRTVSNLALIVMAPIVLWIVISLFIDLQSFKGSCGIFGEYNKFYACNIQQYLLGGETLPAIFWATIAWSTFAIPLALLQRPILKAFHNRRYWRGLAFILVILLVGAPFEIFMPIQILLTYYRW